MQFAHEINSIVAVVSIIIIDSAILRCADNED